MAILRDDPYQGQNFLVDLGDGTVEGPQAGFLEVTGLESSIEVIEYRTGNDKEGSARKIPGLSKAGDVTLKRGIIGSLNLYRWFDAVRNGEDARRTVTIMLVNEKREPVMVWKLLRAQPVKIGFGGLNATGSDIAMEELVLAYERLEME